MDRWVRPLALALACLTLCGCLSAEEYWTFGLSRDFDESLRSSSSFLRGNPVAEAGILFLVFIDIVFLPVAIIHDVTLALLGKSLWAALECSGEPEGAGEPSRPAPCPCSGP
jgi:hypothetical protein